MIDRVKRLESLFLEEIASFVSRHYVNKFGGVITISAVKVARNLKNAKVYYSIMGEKKSPAELQKITADIKRNVAPYLSKRIRTRRIPSLTFEFDTTAQNANRFEEVLTRIKKEKDHNEHE